MPSKTCAVTEKELLVTRLATASGAIFDKHRRYRYLLWRNFREDAHDNFLSIVMLNPSAADEHHDDPTIKSCTRLARGNGFDGFTVTNLFAYCTAYPDELFSVRDPVGRHYGRQNDYYLALAAGLGRATLLAWGNAALRVPGRVEEALRLLDNTRACHLGMTGQMQPRHPLYVAASAKLQALPGSYFGDY